MKIIVANMDQLYAVRNAWNAIVHSMEMPNIFLTWEWVTTWIEHFGSAYDSLILMGYEDEQLVCILPLAKKRLRLEDGFLKQQVVIFCGALELYPDHLDIICAKHIPHTAVADYITAFIHFLYKNNTFDVLYLPYLSEHGHLSTWVQRNIKEHSVIKGNETFSPFISFEGDINSYFESMGKKKRYNVKREAKILFEQKKASMTCLMNENEVADGLHDLLRLHAARSCVKGIESTFINDQIMKYHFDFARKAGPLDWIRIFQLKEDSNVIASAYGFMFHQRFSYYQTGFDPTWSHFSPGNVLIYSMLDFLSREGIREFDFLGGNDGYKLFWTKECRLMHKYMIFNQGPVPYIEYILQKIKGLVKGIVKRLQQ